jgi:hypothetical protein
MGFGIALGKENPSTTTFSGIKLTQNNVPSEGNASFFTSNPTSTAENGISIS